MSQHFSAPRSLTLSAASAAERRPATTWRRALAAFIRYLRYPQTRVRPTSFGIYFILMALVVGMAAVNTGNNLLFLVFSLMLSSLFVSGITSRAAMRHLALSRRMPETVYAATPFTEAVTITNRKRLFPSVSLRIASSISTGTAYLPHLAPRVSRTMILEDLYPRRGWQEVPPLEWRSHYPFGFFERRHADRHRDSVLVFPRIERIVPFFPEREGGHGERAAQFKGEGEDLFQIREYVPGESARAIDWKASSRVAKLMARDFHRNAHIRVTLIVDSSCAEPTEADEVERQISLAASMIDYLCHAQITYQLLTTGGVVPFGSGPRQYRECLSLLAVLEQCDPSTGAEFCRSVAPHQVSGSIPIYFTVHGAVRELAVKAYRVLPAERSGGR